MKEEYQMLESIHVAIQEAMNGNMDDLDQALDFVEILREKHMCPYCGSTCPVDEVNACVSWLDYNEVQS